jgi:hypothetical protein
MAATFSLSPAQRGRAGEGAHHNATEDTAHESLESLEAP